jgi:uncharacterized protein with FMN-binding domain
MSRTLRAIGERLMARKANRNLVALGAATVAAVYAVGFARTALPVRASLVRGSHAPPATFAAGRVALAPSLTSAAPYADGTYVGLGSNRVGRIKVVVTVQGGRIADVRIVTSTMHYPTARIAALAGRVIAQQSTQIELVSGATYSASAFRDAVSDALAQAVRPSPNVPS